MHTFIRFLLIVELLLGLFLHLCQRLQGLLHLLSLEIPLRYFLVQLSDEQPVACLKLLM